MGTAINVVLLARLVGLAFTLATFYGVDLATKIGYSQDQVTAALQVVATVAVTVITPAWLGVRMMVSGRFGAKSAEAHAVVEAKAAAYDANREAIIKNAVPNPLVGPDNMRKLGLLLAIGIGLTLSACAPSVTDPPGANDRPVAASSQARLALATACDQYSAALVSATARLRSGDLSSAGAEQYARIRATVGPVCETQPADIASALPLVQRAVVDLATLPMEAKS